MVSKQKSASAASATDLSSGNAVRMRAYEIWLNEGRPEGRALEHWLLAERELTAPQAEPQRRKRKSG